MPSCYAPGCNHASRKENCNFFRFPADRKLFEEWKSLCPSNDREPTTEDRLCSCHFIDGNKCNLPTVFAHGTNNFEFEQLDEGIKPLNNQDLNTDNMLEKDEFECRACLDKIYTKVCLVNLFQAWTQPWEGMESTIAEDLAKIGNIQLSTSDKHSKVICYSCYKKLRNACSFAAAVKKSNKILCQRFHDGDNEENEGGTVWPKPIQLDKNVNGTVFNTTMDIEIKQEVLSDNDYSENMIGGFDGQYKELADCVEIKIEPEEMMRPPPIQINGSFSYKDSDESTNAPFKESQMFEEYLETPLKEEPTSDIDSDPVCTDLPLECLLCAKTFHSVSGLKAHVIAQHSYKTVKRKMSSGQNTPSKKKEKYVCGTCKRSFITSTDLMVHETCHNKATCYSCNQKFDTFEQLTNHRVRCKVISTMDLPKPKTLEDVKRTLNEDHKINGLDDEDLPKDQLQCHLCPEKFSDSYYMKIHQEIHHNSEAMEQPPEPAAPLPMETEALETIFTQDK